MVKRILKGCDFIEYTFDGAYSNWNGAFTCSQFFLSGYEVL